MVVDWRSKYFGKIGVYVATEKFGYEVVKFKKRGHYADFVYDPFREESPLFTAMNATMLLKRLAELEKNILF